MNLKSQAIHTPSWDMAYIFSGLWFAGALWAFGIHGVHDWPYLPVLLTFVSAIHVLAPIFLLYFSSSMAALRRSDLRTCLIKPALIFFVSGALVFLFFSTGSTELRAIGLWATAAAYILANSRHISRQHYGILVLYKNRVSMATTTSRKIDSWVCWSSNIFLLLIWLDQLRYYGQGLEASQLVLIGGFALPQVVVTLGLITGSIFVVYELKQEKISYFRLFYGVLVASQAYIATHAPFLTAVAFVWQHMTAEIGLSSKALERDGALRSRGMWGGTILVFAAFAIFLTLARNLPAVDSWVRSGTAQLTTLSLGDHLISTVAASGMMAFFFLHVYTNTVIYKSNSPILKKILIQTEN